MKRVLVIGSCGAGKSTFAKRLQSVTGLELIHLDKFYHKPNWEEPNESEWVFTVNKLVEGKEWIIDGNFGGTMDFRMQYCDTVIWLDFPRMVCLWRVVKRTLTYYNRNRPDVAEGCKERFDWEFLKYVWNFRRDKNPNIETRLKNLKDAEAFCLRTNNEVEVFFSDLNSDKVL